MITFSQVTKSFGDDEPALKDVSFHIESGELAVVTGPSGSGKTTIVKLLTKEYLPTEGEITFDQRPLSSIPPRLVHHHRRQIGVAFQDYRLLEDLNVWENVALALSIVNKPLDETERRVTDLLELVKLGHKALLFPKQLSGGEAQRVAIARALSTGPKLIIADEPTGNLDVDTSKSIAKLLSKINGLGTTVMVTTHDPVMLDELSGYKHLVLEGGKLTKGASQPPAAEPGGTDQAGTGQAEPGQDEAPHQEEKRDGATSEGKGLVGGLVAKILGKRKDPGEQKPDSSQENSGKQTEQAEKSQHKRAEKKDNEQNENRQKENEKKVSDKKDNGQKENTQKEGSTQSSSKKTSKKK